MYRKVFASVKAQLELSTYDEQIFNYDLQISQQQQIQTFANWIHGKKPPCPVPP